MKHVLYTILALTISVSAAQAQQLKYIMRVPRNIITSKYEASSLKNGDKELVFTNSDYCPYYLINYDDKRGTNLRPGKNVVERFSAKSAVKSIYMSGRYQCLRGCFPKEFDPQFVYALPVSNGKSVSWQIDDREPYRTFQFMTNYRDTVYACRKGTACKNESNTGILLHHNDETFAAYMNLAEIFVFPGEEVAAGAPVGTASHTGVSVSFFFLDENSFVDGKPVGTKYTYFSPVFRTDKGDVKLNADENYTCIVDDPLVMQDMSKSEQKRYLKKKTK